MSQPNSSTSKVTTTASVATRATCAEFSAATTCAPGPKLTLETLDLTDGARFTDAYGRWLRLIGYDSGATIDQHPDIVLRDLSSTAALDHLRPVALLANPSEVAIQSLAAAILVPRELRLNSLGGLGFPWKLCGYRLVGDSLLGWRGIECQRFVLSAVLDWLRQHGADFLLVENVDQRSTLASLLCADGDADFIRFPAMPQRPLPRIRFPTPPADVWRKFSPKAFNSLRQKAKSIVRSRLVRVTEPDQVPNFIEHVDAVSHSSEPRRRRSSVASDCRELQMCLLLAERRWLRSYVWTIDGTPAGFVIGYQNRSGFRLRRLHCDNRHDRHSAETIMLFRVLEDLIKHDTPLAADFGPGDEPYKRLFANELVRTSDMLLVRRSRGLRACLRMSEPVAAFA